MAVFVEYSRKIIVGTGQVVQQWSQGLSRTWQTRCLSVVHRLAASAGALTKTALHLS